MYKLSKYGGTVKLFLVQSFELFQRQHSLDLIEETANSFGGPHDTGARWAESVQMQVIVDLVHQLVRIETSSLLVVQQLHELRDMFEAGDEVPELFRLQIADQLLHFRIVLDIFVQECYHVVERNNVDEVLELVGESTVSGTWHRVGIQGTGEGQNGQNGDKFHL